MKHSFYGIIWVRRGGGSAGTCLPRAAGYSPPRPQPTVQALQPAGLGEGCSPPPTRALQVWMQECWSGHVNGRKKRLPSQRPLASSSACRLAGCVTLGKALGLWMGSFLGSSCAQRGNEPWGCCVWAKGHTSAEFPQTARHKRCSKRAASFPGPLPGSTHLLGHQRRGEQGAGENE